MKTKQKELLKRESILLALWLVLAVVVFFTISASNEAKAVLLGLSFVAWCGGWVSKMILDMFDEET